MNELVKINDNNQVTTDSKTLADYFGKEHKNILRDIEGLDIPEDFRRLNFERSTYKSKNRNGQFLPAYEMTFDGFTLLAMGFTGKKAMEFKVKYIKAFRAMEAKLKGVTTMPAPVPSLTQDKSALKVIGGLVKKCAAVAIRDELKDILGREVKEVIKDQFMDFVMRTFACAEDLKPFQKVTDDMLLRGLYDWYSTRHHKLLDTVKELDEENGQLKSKLETVKKTVN